MKKRRPDKILQEPLYWFLRTVTILGFKTKFRMIILNEDRIPLTGPVILASNHVSSYDPQIIGINFPAYVGYMGKEELFEKKFKAWYLRGVGTFPVKRGATDTKAIKTALKILKEGKCLGIFPEGGRSEDGEIKEGKDGAAMISIMSGVPILPSAIVGTRGADTKEFWKKPPRRKPVLVSYGDLIHPETFEGSKKERMEKITQTLLDSVRQIKKELEKVWEQSFHGSNPEA